MKSLLLVAAFTFASLAVQGQAGVIDTNFNAGWYSAYLSGGGPDDNITAFYEQTDGKILVGGFFDNFSGSGRKRLARLNADGSFDLGFDAGTYFSTAQGTSVNAMLERSGGKFLVGGSPMSLTPSGTFSHLIQLNYDGTIDSAFYVPNTSGYITQLVEQPNGKILVAGNTGTVNDGVTSRSMPCRLNADGSVDPTFDSGTGVNNVVTSMQLQPDGKVILAGHFTTCNGVSVPRIVRLNADGSIDASFVVGTGANNPVRAMKLQDNGKVVIGGSFTAYNGQTTGSLARLNSDGSLDPTFNTGAGLAAYANSLTIKSNGNIVVGSTATFVTYNGNNYSGILQVDSLGAFSPETSNFEGVSGSGVLIVHELMSGQLLISGSFYNVGVSTRARMARIQPDLMLDHSFYKYPGAQGSIIESVEVDPTGKILITGSFNNYNDDYVAGLTRLLPDGTRDTNFLVPDYSGNFKEVKVYQDTMLLVGMGAYGFLANTQRGIMRLHNDGSFDPSFISGSGIEANAYVTCIEVQPDNKILLGGDFTTFNGQSFNGLVRLNSDGTIDNSFHIGSGFNGSVSAIHYGSMGQIYVGGTFTLFNGDTCRRIACLLPNGDLDTNFHLGAGFDDGVYAIEAYQNKLVVGGSFDTYDGAPAIAVAILETNGNLNPNFNSPINSIWSNKITNICVQPDDKVLIGGSFNITSTSNAYARLNADGSVDNAFAITSMSLNAIKDSYLRPNGDILLVGIYSTLQGYFTNKIGQLHNDTLGLSTLALNFSNISNIQCGAMIGNATSMGSGGAPPYTYTWLNSANPNNATQDFTSGGMYTCTVTDTLGVTVTESIFITEPTTQSTYDVEGYIIGGTFRPGFDDLVLIDVVNHGCTPTNGQVKLVLDPLVSYVSAVPTPTTISNDTLMWDYNTLYYDTSNFLVQIITNTSLQAQIGDSVQLQIITNPTASDAYPLNNDKNYIYSVVNGYDPNDKNVYPYGKCDDKFVQYDEELTYTVRFQNTGNSEAINIAVMDTLDASLDMTSVQLLAASHNVLLKGLNGNVLRFEFDNIQLPDSASNEPLSHGFAIFKVKPLIGVPHGTLLHNKVEIYFDYNPPIVTNTTENTLFVGDLDTLNCFPGNGGGGTGIDETSMLDLLKIYPNPFSESIHVEAEGELLGETLEVIDLFGTIYQKQTLQSTHTLVDLSGLKSGIYFIRVGDSITKVLKN